ncbi:MAG TPA: hypothetical protein VF998_04790 [Candidatus Limnocylindria bacterium]
MRLYVTASPATWWTTAPQVPGAAAEDAPTREEAIARCRTRAHDEAEAFRRLGHPIELGDADEVIDWTLPWWLIPDSLIPTPPALLRAAMTRVSEVAAEVDEFLDSLPKGAWDRDPGDGWTIRRTLDHAAGGFGIGLRRLEPWPLDADRAQAEAARELVARLKNGEPGAFEQVGPNQRPSRVRWTPRKVARTVRSLQAAWLAHLAGEGPAPSLPYADDDGPDDDARPAADELDAILVADAALRRAAERDPRVRAIASWYRYYRDRLVPWPIGVRERWLAMRSTWQGRLAALGESDLALIRVAPNGQCDTVRMQLGLGLGHVQEHLEQMKRTARAPT